MGRNLYGSRVLILGGGGIVRDLLPLLAPFGTHNVVLRRTPTAVEGAQAVATLESLHDELPLADVVVLALAVTPETEGVIGAPELALMKDDAWLVNLARGVHVDTQALIEVLEAEAIGGACLDVTDPEPLPTGHPLWAFDNCLITPHVGNTPEMGIALLAERGHRERQSLLSRRGADRPGRPRPRLLSWRFFCEPKVPLQRHFRFTKPQRERPSR